MVTPAAGVNLNIAGGISGAGGLTVGGAGTVVLTGVDNYSGPTTVLTVALAATSAAAIAPNTSLTIGAGGTFIFDPSSTAAPLEQPATASDDSAADATKDAALGALDAFFMHYGQ